MAEAPAGRKRQTGARGAAARRRAPGSGGDTTPERHDDPACNIGLCPICAAVMAAQKSGPEAVGHLLAATRELLLAAKAVLDVKMPDVKPERRVQRIEVK